MGEESGKITRASAKALAELLAESRRKGTYEDRTPPRKYDQVKVKNSSGGDLRRGEVLEITSFLLSEMNPEYPWFDGDTPDLTNVGWGISLKPVPENEITDFLLTGRCIAYVIINDEDHQYATRKSGSVVLDSCAYGPVKILHKQPASEEPELPEERECWVQIDDPGTPCEVVQVYHSSGSQGETVSANADGFHPGRVKRWAGGMETLEDCWIRFVDEHDTNDGSVTAKDSDYFIGRLSGSDTSDGSTRPTYMVRKGGEAPPWYLGITRETFTQGIDEFVEVDIYEWQVDKWRKITIPPDGFVSARDWFLNKDEVLEKKTKVRVDYYRTTWVVTAMYCSPTDLDELDDVVPPSPGELEQLANQQPFEGGGVMMPALVNGPDSGLVLFPDGDSETQNFPWFPNS